MKFLVKSAVFAGLATVVYKWLKPAQATNPTDTGPIRDAGPHEQHGVSAKSWDKVDDQSDASFPASDAPGNY